MSEALFDLSEHYDEMLRKGVSLSGEDPEFFMRARIDDLHRQLASSPRPARILDFGCGTGGSSAYLTERFPGAYVLGVDTSVPAIEMATRQFGSAKIAFATLDSIESAVQTGGPFDLCYVNGVFHHIIPAERAEAVSRIFAALRPGAHFALFENNPWNPGTRMVMNRIPFDRDAITLPYRETEGLLRSAGFRLTRSTRFLFYFPRSLRILRPLEPALASLPLGAQYYVLGIRP
jgi:SAM-dependent methyltransferase